MLFSFSSLNKSRHIPFWEEIKLTKPGVPQGLEAEYSPGEKVILKPKREQSLKDLRALY